MENEPTPVVEPRLNTNKALLMNSLSMGLIIAGIFVLLSVMYYILDINMMSILSSILMFLVNLAVLITTITMVMKKFRDKINGGTTTYTKSLFSGWIAGFIGRQYPESFRFCSFISSHPNTGRNKWQNLAKCSVRRIFLKKKLMR